MGIRKTLVTAVRNEGPFLLEWIAYHELIGFNDIIIYSQTSDDGTQKLLNALDQAGVIQHIDNTGPDTPPGHQQRAYQALIDLPAIQISDWVMVLDVDEFLNIHAGDGFLDDLFDAIGDFDLLSLCWRNFGNNGIVKFENQPILSRLVAALPDSASNPKNNLGLKTLFRPDMCARIGPHRPVLHPDYRNGDATFIWKDGAGADIGEVYKDKGWAARPDMDGRSIAEVNHYPIRSNEQFMLQYLRGFLPGSDTKAKSTDDYYAQNNNHMPNSTITRHCDAVAARIATLRQHKGVAKAHDGAVDIWTKAITDMRRVLKENRDTLKEEIALLSEKLVLADLQAQQARLQKEQQEAEQAELRAKLQVKEALEISPRWLADLRRSKYRNGFYHSATNFAAQFTRRETDVLVISFDNLSDARDPSLSREPWGYQFYRAENWSHLGVLAFAGNWYRDEELFDFMEEKSASGFFEGFGTVVLTGASMGGYAATAFSSLCPGSVVIAYSPQATLDSDLVPWEERFASGRNQNWQGRYKDAADHTGKSSRVYIIYDPHFEPELRHAERYSGDNVVHLKSWYSAHKSALFMRRTDILKQVTHLAISGDLDRARFYAIYRVRRELNWYLAGVADRLIETGHMGLARQLAVYLKRIGRTGLAKSIEKRIE